MALNALGHGYSLGSFIWFPEDTTSLLTDLLFYM